MFYFVFSNWYHRLPIKHEKQQVIRSNFKKDIIRKSIGNKWKLFGYGTHDLHKKLYVLDYQNMFKGHILVVENPEHAIWIKLNYENICNEKWDIKLEGIYKDIDITQIHSIISDIHDLDNLKNKYLSLYSYYTHLNKSLRLDFVKSNFKNIDSKVTDQCDSIIDFNDSINAYISHSISSIDDITKLIKNKKEECIKFINSYKYN